jgi:cold shock CspA family protein
MAKGKVSSWNTDRGYGFIQSDNRESVFCHVNDFTPRAEPEVGQRVEFDIVKDDRKDKLRADNIRMV